MLHLLTFPSQSVENPTQAVAVKLYSISVEIMANFKCYDCVLEVSSVVLKYDMAVNSWLLAAVLAHAGILNNYSSIGGDNGNIPSIFNHLDMYECHWDYCKFAICCSPGLEDARIAIS